MRAAIGGIGAALVASACCIGPVAFSLIGLGASAHPLSGWSRIVPGSSR